MCDFFDGDTFEPVVDTTPNIEFQINKFSEDEPLFKNIISSKSLFATSETINQFKSLYEANIDMPIIVYGSQGIGKLTCIIGLIQYLPSYLPSCMQNYSRNSIESIDSIDKKLKTKQLKQSKINKIPKTKLQEEKQNNIHFFKILDSEFNKIFFYENIYYLNIEILNNNTEILNYLKYIYQLAKTSNITIFDNIYIDEESNNRESNNSESNNSNLNKTIEKKIIIITHIDKCNNEAHKYISFMLDKINCYTSYIFTSHSINTIDKKILSLCAPINYKYLDEISFLKIFKYNFKNVFEKDNYTLTPSILKQFYHIYVSNKYNIGNTISQIKYHVSIEGIAFLKNKQNKLSLMSKIAENFIKKKLILSKVSSALEIRKFLYTLLSLNIKLINFVKEVVKQLNSNNKLNNKIKNTIIEKASLLSTDINNANKDIIVIEAFFYDIITIIYEENNIL